MMGVSSEGSGTQESFAVQSLQSDILTFIGGKGTAKILSK